MIPITLHVPAKALDAIQDQIDLHNRGTGAELQLTPFLERHIVELAAQPAFQAATPALEAERDAYFQTRTQDAMAEIIASFQDAPS